MSFAGAGLWCSNAPVSLRADPDPVAAAIVPLHPATLAYMLRQFLGVICILTSRGSQTPPFLHSWLSSVSLLLFLPVCGAIRE